MVTIKLPWPPSVNRYYRHVGAKVLISKAGRAYRKAVADLLLVERKRANFTGRLSMTMAAYPPDRRRRDLDNLQKAIWDALQHGGLYRDDSQIKRFEATMHEPGKPGFVVVTVIETAPERTRAKAPHTRSSRKIA